MFKDSIKRSRSSTIRAEDSALIYYEDNRKKYPIVEDTYRDCTYEIVSNGNFPTVAIYKDIEMSVNTGKIRVTLKNHNGHPVELNRSLKNHDEVMYFYNYNKPGDFILNKQDGKKYSIKELEADCKAFIDGIREAEDDMINSLK